MSQYYAMHTPQHSVDNLSSYAYDPYMASRPGTAGPDSPMQKTFGPGSSQLALTYNSVPGTPMGSPGMPPPDFGSRFPKSEEPAPPRPSGPPGGPPPDGGLTAWLQVLGGYFLFMNTWGIINAFGVFQSYYAEELLKGTSNSTISWIGTLTSFLLCASPLSWGPIFDRGNIRALVLFGSGSVVFGIMMTSLCNAYWQLMLAQGFCVGIGGGCTFLTATSILPTYFAKKRSLAMGIAASGSSLGGIIYPIVFHQLQPKIGFGWSVRIIGFLALATLAVPCTVMRSRVPKPTTRRKIFDTTILREIPFQTFNVATFFGFVGQYIPFFFIEQFALTHGIAGPFWMLIVLNAGSIPGRIVPSLIADKFLPPLVVLGSCTGSATILAFAWTAIRDSRAGLVIWALLYGFCAGAFVSLQGPCVAAMTTDMRTIGTRFGVNMFAGALGILIGSPVGGAIFPESWPGAQSFCGATLLCSSLAIAATWFVWQREKNRGQRKLQG